MRTVKSFKISGLRCCMGLLVLAGWISCTAWARDESEGNAGQLEADGHYEALGDTSGMSPTDAIAETLRTNPEIFADKSGWLAEKHSIDIAKAGYLPKLDFRANGGGEYTREHFKRSNCGLGRKCREDKLVNTPSLSARQPIFDGFRASTDVSRAERETDQAIRKIAETQELVSFRAVNAFIDTRRFQRLLRLAIANAKAHRQILGKVNALIQGGKATIADRALVASRLADAESAVVDIAGDLGSARARFIDVVGQTPDRLKRSTIAEGILPVEVSDALRASAEKNRSLLLAKSSVEVARAEFDTTEVPFWPTLDIELDARRDKNTEGREGYESSATALVVLRYNIFNGGADMARRKEVTEQVSETRHREAAALRTAEREVRVSWAEMKSAMRQSEALRVSVTQKEKVIRAREKQFDLGTVSLLDLLDAWNEFFLAKGSLITVDATADLTGYRLLAAMGTLLSSHNLVMPLEPAPPVAAQMTSSDGEMELTPLKKEVGPDPTEVMPGVELDAPVAEPKVRLKSADSVPIRRIELAERQQTPEPSSSYTYDDPAVGHGINFDGELVSGESVTY